MLRSNAGPPLRALRYARSLIRRSLTDHRGDSRKGDPLRHVASWTGEETVTLFQVIEHLNLLLQKDRGAVSRLILQRVPCDKTLATDAHLAPRAGSQEIGTLGLLNGLFGVDHRGNGLGGGIGVVMQGTMIQAFTFNAAPPVVLPTQKPAAKRGAKPKAPPLREVNDAHQPKRRA